MSAVDTTRLLDAKAIKFGTSTSSTTYQAAFQECLQKVLVKISNFTGYPLVLVTDLSTPVMDDVYYSVLSSGLDFYLQDTNLFTANPVPDAEDRFYRDLKEAQRVYLSTQDMHVRFGTLPPNPQVVNTEGFIQ